MKTQKMRSAVLINEPVLNGLGNIADYLEGETAHDLGKSGQAALLINAYTFGGLLKCPTPCHGCLPRMHRYAFLGKNQVESFANRVAASPTGESER